MAQDRPDKLSFEEKDHLAQIIADRPVWNVLVKVMRDLEQRYIDDVMNYDLNSGPEGLVIRKARAEGIASFITNLDDTRDRLIGGGKNDVRGKQRLGRTSRTKRG